MASNLRVDNIQPTTGTGIGIGTANGSVTFNADVTGGMNIATGGMNIATGSLGVGINNPTESKVVIGHTQTSTVKHLAIKDLTNNWVRKLGVDSSNNFGIFSGDIEHLRITGTGSVGIGVTDPSEKLEVRGGKIFIDGGGNRKITLDPGSNATYDSRIDASHTLVFRSYVDAGVGVKTCTFNTNGHLLPGDDNGQDLGASNARWRNIYTGDLNLSNEGSANDVDGTWGQYTIQEGEDDLFLINRRTGKKYKFNLTEVD